MTLKKRLRAGACVLACAAAVAFHAHGEEAAPHALSAQDVEHYVAAFGDVDRGDFIDAQMQSAAVQDKSLLGYISFSQLMHPTAHKAAFEELSGWLARFRDLPVADRVFALAAKRKPPYAADPPQPALLLSSTGAEAPAQPFPPTQAQKAREAFYAGDVQRALALAPAAGERWIAGMAAYRLHDFAQAEGFFAELARDQGQDAWTRAAGGFWAARAADALGQSERSARFLRAAAELPGTFYGMIAERKLQLMAGADAGPPSIESLIRAAYLQPPAEVQAFVKSDQRAHRAAALAQIGRFQECSAELRAGLALARSDEERARWSELASTLGVPATVSAPGMAPRVLAPADYPTPLLEPKSGFTLDKALVYAIVRQESAFNPMAVSPKGAVGLMQLMPEAAARAAGDDKLKADMSAMFDPAFNLRVGQDYVTWLMQTGTGYDLIKTVAAYNGGPGVVIKALQAVGGGADDLLLLESIPAYETRNYVQRVMAGYWTYRRQFGQDVKSLDALAAGALQADARLDLADPGRVPVQLGAKPLEIGMR